MKHREVGGFFGFEMAGWSKTDSIYRCGQSAGDLPAQASFDIIVSTIVLLPVSKAYFIYLNLITPM